MFVSVEYFRPSCTSLSGVGQRCGRGRVEENFQGCELEEDPKKMRDRRKDDGKAHESTNAKTVTGECVARAISDVASVGLWIAWAVTSGSSLALQACRCHRSRWDGRCRPGARSLWT